MQILLHLRGVSLQKRWNTLLGFDQEMLEVKEGSIWNRLVHERRRNTGLPAPPSTADAMNVVLNLIRKIKVNDVLDVWEVQALDSEPKV